MMEKHVLMSDLLWKKMSIKLSEPLNHLLMVKEKTREKKPDCPEEAKEEDKAHFATN